MVYKFYVILWIYNEIHGKAIFLRALTLFVSNEHIFVHSSTFPKWKRWPPRGRETFLRGTPGKLMVYLLTIGFHGS